MTDNLQLQTSRLTNASVGNLIDDSLADIEHCLRTIFKITADTPISQAMSIVAAGNVTMVGDLTLAGAPTNALHAATKKYVDDNISASTLYLTNIYAAGQTVAATTTELITFGGVEAEVGSSDQWDAADPTKFVCKSAGDYLLMGIVAFGGGSADLDEFYVNLLKNGASLVGNIIGVRNTSIYQSQATFGLQVTLAENDYIQMQINNPGTDPGDVAAGSSTGWSSSSGGTFLSTLKVS